MVGGAGLPREVLGATPQLVSPSRSRARFAGP
jgi:hypothetical protein